jgi:hypothetical protein
MMTIVGGVGAVTQTVTPSRTNTTTQQDYINLSVLCIYYTVVLYIYISYLPYKILLYYII